MQEATVYRWDGNRLALSSPTEASIEGRLRVAESWLVSQGAVRSLLLHYRRFQQSANAWQGSPPMWDFLTAVTRRLPRSGDWFPRIEYVVGNDGLDVLQMRLRAAPQRESTARIVTHPVKDPRQYPQIMGPDLAMLLQIGRQANMYGADESVLLDERGRVLSTTFNSLAWWRGETLCFPPASERIYPSIARDQAITIAEASGVAVEYEWVTPADLVDHEVWLLGALHGIRAVTEWTHHGEALPVAPSRRARLWQRRLDQFALPLPTASAPGGSAAASGGATHSPDRTSPSPGF